MLKPEINKFNQILQEKILTDEIQELNRKVTLSSDLHSSLIFLSKISQNSLNLVF